MQKENIMEPMERIKYFFDSVNKKDGEAALSCFEPNAVLSLAPNGEAALGHSEIEEALVGFLAMTMTLGDTKEVRSPDGQIALTSLNWSAEGSDDDGNPITMTGQSTEVLRRQPDGNWLMVIDSPWWRS